MNHMRLFNIANHLKIQKQSVASKKKQHLQKVYDNYLHAYDKRTQQQISQTTKRIKQISKANISRLNKLQQKQIVYPVQKLKQKVLICISGIPPFPEEFGFFQLDCKTYVVKAQGFDFHQSEQQRIKNIPNCHLSVQADKIRKIIESQKDKQIIFVYHSFGTYLLSGYLHKYGHDRIIGLIQIGAVPITMYRYIPEVIDFLSKYTQQDIIRNMDIVGLELNQLIERLNKELGLQWNSFPMNSMAASFLSYFKSQQFPILFDINRRYPNILKLMIFGDYDPIFQTDLICQRADFYSKQEIKDQVILKEKFQKHSKANFNKLQQQFIMEIPQGKHSVHLQKKHQSLIRKAIKQYLNVIL